MTMLKSAQAKQAKLNFKGFISPRYTQVPDELFDELMAHLSGAELKVLLYSQSAYNDPNYRTNIPEVLILYI